jgi:hypothetical protein
MSGTLDFIDKPILDSSEGRSARGTDPSALARLYTSFRLRFFSLAITNSRIRGDRQ